MKLYMLKFYCGRTGTACVVRSGFKRRREAYRYRGDSVGRRLGEFSVRPYYRGRTAK